VLLDRRQRIKTFERARVLFPLRRQRAAFGVHLELHPSPLGTGALNSLLGVFGIGPIGWISDPWLAKISIIIVAVWTSTGWHTVVNIAYLQAIPTTYYEAAPSTARTSSSSSKPSPFRCWPRP
jgi:ABC-type sugar transport system permease subunit